MKLCNLAFDVFIRELSMFCVKPANNWDGSHPQRYKEKPFQLLYKVVIGKIWQDSANISYSIWYRMLINDRQSKIEPLGLRTLSWWSFCFNT